MITFVCGRPGAGKTFFSVSKSIIPAIQQGRPVATNVPLEIDKISEHYQDAQVFVLEDISPDTWANIPNGSLVVLDELGNIWPSGMRANMVPEKDREFIAQHRHRVGSIGNRQVAMDIILISQGSGDIASFLRSKISKTIIVEKLSAIGADNKYRFDVYNNFQDSERPKKSEHLQTVFGTYDPKLYKFYRSHSQATPGLELTNVEEIGSTKKYTIFNSMRFRAFIALLVFAVFGFLFTAKATVESIETKKTVQHSSVSKPAPPPPASKPAPPPPVSKPAPPPEPKPQKTDWYIGGYAEWAKPGGEMNYLIQLRHVQNLSRYVNPEPGMCEKRLGILTCDLGDGLIVSDVPQRIAITAGIAPMQ